MAAEITKPQRGSDARALKSVINLEVNHVANPSTAHGFQQQPSPMLWADTPEAAVAYNHAVDPRCIDDIMLCGLARSGAVVMMLLGDLSENGSRAMTESTLTNVLWLLQGQIEQMQMVMRNYRKGVAV